MDELLKATIKVEQITVGENRIVVMANGKSFSFFKTKKDGNETVAYETFKELDIQAGDAVNISYDETEQKKDGKTYRYKNIKKFLKVDMKNAAPSMGEKVVQTDSEQTEGRVRHGVVCAMIAAGVNLTTIKEESQRYVDFILGKRPALDEEIDVDDIPTA